MDKGCLQRRRVAFGFINSIRIMKKENHDYSLFLATIAIWIMIGGLAQCESAEHLDDIRRELNGIKHELNLTRYE